MHDAAMLNAITQDIAAELSGERIWILNTAGVVQASSQPDELGRHYTQASPECRLCHDRETEAPPAASRILQPEPAGVPVLVSASPIANEPKCAGCHPASVRTLGLVLIQSPLTDLGRQLQNAAGRVALGAGAAFALLVGLLGLALRKFIIAPMGELAQGVAAMDAKDLDHSLAVDSTDEFGALAAAFDALRARLSASKMEMEHRNQELAVLYEVALVTGQLLERQQILDQVLDVITARLALEVGLIYLWNETQQRFITVCTRGLSEWQLQLIDQKRRQPGGDLTSDVARTGQVHYLPDITLDPHFAGTYKDSIGRSYVNVPLKSQGKVVGTLELVSRAEHPITPRQVDILAAVGHQIGIAIDNTTLLLDTRRAAHEALTLYQLGSTVSASLDLPEVLDAVARVAREVLNGDLGLVALVDADLGALAISALSGPTQAEWRGLRLPLEAATSWVQADLAAGADLPPALAERLAAEQIQSMLVVPLQRGDQRLGCVAALARAPRAFTADQAQLLTRLAHQVVVAIENARLYQQVRYLAVLEERDRLAREMHDNLAQALGFLNLKASLTSGLLASGEAEQARAALAEMKQVTHAAYEDTREAIFNLRNAVWKGGDLLPLLHEYLAEYRAHYGLDARLKVEDAAGAVLSREVSTQLSRIIQEALTNIRKHAQATQVWIHLKTDQALTRVVIQDNGRGFDPAAHLGSHREHFGLQIMRERAAGVGGLVTIESQIGAGTRVIVDVPRQTPSVRQP
jgi:nitrate/nitrite-specific signal transduction histidine kinase